MQSRCLLGKSDAYAGVDQFALDEGVMSGPGWTVMRYLPTMRCVVTRDAKLVVLLTKVNSLSVEFIERGICACDRESNTCILR